MLLLISLTRYGGRDWMIHPGRVVRSKPFFEPSDFRVAL